MRAARPVQDIDRELSKLRRRHVAAREEISELLATIADIEDDADVLLDRRLALLADADR